MKSVITNQEYDNYEYFDKVSKLITKVFQEHGINHVILSNDEYRCQPTDLRAIPKGKPIIMFSLECIGPDATQMLRNLAQQVPDNPVIVLILFQRVEKNWPDMPDNLFWLQIGTMMPQNNYHVLVPQREKNPNMDTFWVGLCHSPRAHKIFTACCLLGHDLGLAYEPMTKTGLLRISNHTIENIELAQYLTTCNDSFSWEDSDWNSLNQDQKNIYQKGFDLLSQCANGGHPNGSEYTQYCDYIRKKLDNPSNFQHHLTKLYKNTLVELVIESSFVNQAIFITEKFKNSVYGFNLPIMFSNPGSVAYLRNIGFDMCDDVIDHSYDFVQEPLQRIFVAVNSNIKLLSDKQYAWQAWTNSLPRLEHNYEFANNKLDEHCLDQIRKQLPDLIQNKLRPVWCPR